MKVEYAFPIKASADRVFAALSQPSELQKWFAEHAEVEPRAGGAYRFWGKHTYGAPSRSHATQILSHYEPAQRIAFTWMFSGAPSQARLDIKPEEDGVQLTVAHEFPEGLAAPRAKHLIEDLWRLNFANLALHLDGKTPLMPDYADPSPTIVMSIEIDAPRERVFKAMLDPDILNKWGAQAAIVEPRIGGAYSFGWEYEVEGRKVTSGPTRILDMVENERLLYDWPDWRGDPDVPGTTVEWTFEEIGPNRTRLTLTHGVFPRAADFSDYPYGWTGLLAAFKALVEGA